MTRAGIALEVSIESDCAKPVLAGHSKCLTDTDVELEIVVAFTFVHWECQVETQRTQSCEVAEAEARAELQVLLDAWKLVFEYLAALDEGYQADFVGDPDTHLQSELEQAAPPNGSSFSVRGPIA